MSANMKSEKGWRWFGYAGHFIGGSRCAFHMATLVKGGRYLVSTVGDYRPGGEKMETIGSGKESFFETYVFKARGVGKDWNPVMQDWSEIDGRRYADSREAEKGHYTYCRKWDK